jgi:hypothetical protein
VYILWGSAGAGFWYGCLIDHSAPNCPLDRPKDRVPVTKANLSLGRMDVHIHIFWRQFNL